MPPWPRRSEPTRKDIGEAEFAQRVHVLSALAAVVGVSTGLAVSAFQELIHTRMFDAVLELPLGWAAVAPGIGLIVAVAITRRWGDGGATTDAYVRSYHQNEGSLHLGRIPATIVACAATLGSGGAMGYEGPAIFLGASFGSFAERHFTKRLHQDDAKVLMVAGAAAGIAAVFKAPLTGVVFALEVPYLQDVARRALLPALVAAGTSYLTFVLLLGTTPIFATGGVAPFDMRDLLGGIALGAVCGALARVGARAIRYAKKLPLGPATKALGAAVGLGALALITNAIYDTPLSLGSGYLAIAWSRGHGTELGLIIALFFLRYLATWLTTAGGGVGGLFIPLVTQGALTGAAVQAVVHSSNPALFPTVGIAAFLGGGYRTPLAGVAFVAEVTGQPGFVVPALLAAAASQLAMGRWSFSAYQRPERQPSITPLSDLRVGDVMSPNIDTVAASSTVHDAVQRMMSSERRWMPVLNGRQYVGILALSDVARRPRESWATLRCDEVARADVPAVDVSASVESVGGLMRSSGVGAVAVTEDDVVRGVITRRDISNVERVLDQLSPEAETS